MTPHDARTIMVAANDGKVVFGTKDDGFFVVSAFRARDLARDLLVAADQADGERPSHIYQVQAYTP